MFNNSIPFVYLAHSPHLMPIFDSSEFENDKTPDVLDALTSLHSSYRFDSILRTFLYQNFDPPSEWIMSLIYSLNYNYQISSNSIASEFYVASSLSRCHQLICGLLSGTNICTGTEVAIKLECIRTRHPQLHIESKIYKIMQGGCKCSTTRYLLIILSFPIPLFTWSL